MQSAPEGWCKRYVRRIRLVGQPQRGPLQQAQDKHAYRPRTRQPGYKCKSA